MKVLLALAFVFTGFAAHAGCYDNARQGFDQRVHLLKAAIDEGSIKKSSVRNHLLGGISQLSTQVAVICHGNITFDQQAEMDYLRLLANAGKFNATLNYINDN